MFSRHIVPGLLLLVLGSTLSAQVPRRRAVQHPAATSSEALIDAALRNGEIDAQTAILYRVFADFDDPRLPERFRGTVKPDTDSSSLGEAELHWDSLSPSAQEAIAPYLIPPFQSGSWASGQGLVTGQSVHAAVDPLQFCGPVNDAKWSSVKAPSGRLRIWWQKSHPGDAAVAAVLVSDGDFALEQYEGLLGRDEIPDAGSILPCRGGDDAIDVALVDASKSQTVPFLPATKKVPSFVLLQRNAQDGPEAELAHELFHVMQFTYDVHDFALANYKWLMEATAQWAMDYHRRPGNSGKEQRAAQLWFDAPKKSLTLVDCSKHEYGGYLFFLYLSRTYGDSTIKDIWNATGGHDAVGAVDSAIPGGFKERWPEFALYAWNRGNLDKFRQWDQITQGAAEHAGTVLDSGASDNYLELPAELPGLSATYLHLVFNGNVRSAAFLNGFTFQLSTPPSMIGTFDVGTQYKWSGASDEAKRGAAIRAVVKKGGHWQTPENWTNDRFKTFCRYKEGENIEELLVVFANSDTDADRKLKAPGLDSLLIATNIGCAWQGTASFTGSAIIELALGHLTVEYHITREPADSSTVVADFLGYPYTTTGHAVWNVSGTVDDCTHSGHNDNAPFLATKSFTMNFAPRGSTSYRKAWFPTLLQDSIKFQRTCPDKTILGDAGIIGYRFPPEILGFLDIQPDGHIEGHADELEGSGTWTWKFTPK